MKKVLIIEDDFVDFLKIQTQLIPDGYLSILPFENHENDELKDKKRKYLSDITERVSEIKQSECFTQSEIEFINILKTKNGISTAKKRVKQIIEEHYNELRLIICDLQICGLPEGGRMLIEYLRSCSATDKILNWFMQEIPIIITTNLDGREPVEATIRGGIKNCMSIKKTIAFDDENIADLFQKIVEIQQRNFDELYRKKIQERDYKVALSFTGRDGDEKHREFVEEIAQHLYSEYTESRVFYDKDKLLEGKTLGLKKEDFTNIYMNQCEYIVVCLSESYATKDNPWTQKEWEGISKYLKKTKNKVIFICIGDGVTATKVKSNLHVDPGLWIEEGNYERKKFYEIMEGNSADLQKSLEEMIYYKKTMQNHLLQYYLAVKKEYKNIANEVTNTIVKHIRLVDDGKK